MGNCFGRVIEVGAYNGLESSSRFFETYLGWKALLLDANPVLFKDLVVNRPGATCVNVAIGPEVCTNIK